MNPQNKEEELKEEIQRMSDIYEVSELSEESGLQDEFEKDIYKIYNRGFQKGKLEAKKEELEFLEDKFIMLNTPEFDNNDAGMVRDDIGERIKQLQKEISSEEIKDND